MVWKRSKSITLVNMALASMSDESKRRGLLMDLSLRPPFSSTEKLGTRGNHLTLQASILPWKGTNSSQRWLHPLSPSALWAAPCHLRGTLASVCLLEAGICPDSVLCLPSLFPHLGCHCPATHDSPTVIYPVTGLQSIRPEFPEADLALHTQRLQNPTPDSFPSKPGEFPNSPSHDRTSIHLLVPLGDTWILLGPNLITSETFTSSLPLF